MSLQILFGLIICNAIWALNPLMGKVLLEQLQPMQVALFRYGSALLVCVAYGLWRFLHSDGNLNVPKEVLRPRSLYWLAIMGFTTFFWSGFSQYTGLRTTTATANSLIVAMEPLFAVLLAWIFLGERIGWRQSVSFLIALSGFGLLSNLRPNALLESFSAFNTGNLLLLLSMPAEAMYTIVSRKLVHRLPATAIYAYALPFGLICIALVLVQQGVSISWPFRFGWKEWGALLWVGPLGSAITYIYWTIALKDAPVAPAVLTLFLQPILGAAFGTAFLGETLNTLQLFGGMLILLALSLQTFFLLRKERL